IQNQQNPPSDPMDPPPPSNQKPPAQRLVEDLAEIKIIRAMQVRLNKRTENYGQRYTGEQAKDPDIVKELDNLANRQQRIFKTTDDFARGKNR
ncbi:MAG: hypothetical protein AB7K24_25245, partial [Gemmataceae bacterium]